MPDVKIRTQFGRDAGSVTLPDDIFGVEPNVPVMHQVVTAQLAARRAGTHSTKSRSEARGGGAKPWRQKGTGRARAGSIRSPLWVGGGRSHGPKPRDYSQRTPKKMKVLALRSALSDRVRCDSLVVVDEWDFDEPKTRDALDVIESLGIGGKSILLVASPQEDKVARSFRNLEEASICIPAELNTYDILRCEVLVVGLETLTDIAGGRVEVKAKKAAKKPATKKTDKAASASGDETGEPDRGDEEPGDGGDDE